MSQLLAYLLIGALLGCLGLWWLRHSMRLYLQPGALPGALLLQLARLAIAACALVIVARQGAVPLLATSAGLLASRLLVVRRMAVS